MRKFKMFWDFEAEERYLHEMAAKGYILQKYTIWGFYHFTKGEPMDLNYKIDYKTFKSQKEFDEYVTLFADAGWVMVSGGRYVGTQYFLPQNEQAGKEIFSDIESAALRFKKFYQQCETYFAIFLCDWIILYTGDHEYMKTLGFLTPGLWQMTGANFWKAFFFELPFATFRMLSPLFFIIVAILYAYWGYRAKKVYQEKVRQNGGV